MGCYSIATVLTNRKEKTSPGEPPQCAPCGVKYLEKMSALGGPSMTSVTDIRLSSSNMTCIIVPSTSVPNYIPVSQRLLELFYCRETMNLPNGLPDGQLQLKASLLAANNLLKQSY